MKRLIYLSCLVMLFGLFGPRLGSAQSSAGVEGLLDKINRLPGAERQQKLVEGARKEGELVWYSTMNRENSQELINLFEKEHPYLRIKLLNGSAVQTMTRINSEYSAKNYLFDITHIRGLFLLPLKKNKLLQPTVLHTGMRFGPVTKTTKDTSMRFSLKGSCSFSIRTWSSLRTTRSRWKIC